MILRLTVAAFMVAGTIMCANAQEVAKPRFYKANKADATFTMFDEWIQHRHKAMLAPGNSITVELSAHKDYELLQDLEGTLRDMTSSLYFMADTVRDCPQCNYRVDYLINSSGMKSYRIRKYLPQGTFLYQKGGSDLKPFKPEADTVHLLLLGAVSKGWDFYSGRAQVTFILNRYSNLDSLLSQKGRINAIIDTFRTISAPRKAHEKKRSFGYSTTISITKNWKDSGKSYVSFIKGLKTDGSYIWPTKAFNAQANIGAGFVRDRLAPEAEIGLLYYLPTTRDQEQKFFIGLYASGYFVFPKGDDGKYMVHDNWFLNAEFGDNGSSSTLSDINLSKLTLGVGYLVSRKGEYFTGTTVKAFMNIRLKHMISVSPEIIATDNFQQIFPGVTLKIF
jgi:hypothetical protein